MRALVLLTNLRGVHVELRSNTYRDQGFAFHFKFVTGENVWLLGSASSSPNDKADRSSVLLTYFRIIGNSKLFFNPFCKFVGKERIPRSAWRFRGLTKWNWNLIKWIHNFLYQTSLWVLTFTLCVSQKLRLYVSNFGVKHQDLKFKIFTLPQFWLWSTKTVASCKTQNLGF